MTMPRPGFVPVRPLRLGEILDGAFATLRRNPGTVLGLSAAVAAIEVVAVLATQLAAADSLGRIEITSRRAATASTGLGPLLGGTVPTLVALATSTLLGALLTGLLAIVIAQDFLGERIDAGQAWRRSRGRRWRLLLVGATVAVAQAAALLLLVVPGVLLWGMWAAAIPALMIERTSVPGALRRSWRLVRGEFWSVFATRACGVVAVTVVRLLITAPFSVAGLAVDGGLFSGSPGTHGGPLVFAALTALGSAVATALTAPVHAGVDTLIYLDRRMRREGLDIVLSARSSEAPIVRTPTGRPPAGRPPGSTAPAGRPAPWAAVS